MFDLISRFALTAALGYAAYVDWRTMRVPFPLMWSILIAGAAVAASERQWLALTVAVAAAVISSLPFVHTYHRRALATSLIGMFSVYHWTGHDGAETALAICVVWMLFELNFIGGADATIAIGLLAMFHTVAFVELLAVTVLAGSLLMLIARYRLGTGRVLLGAVSNLWKMQPPTAQDLEQTGQPAVWKIALAGALYAWITYAIS